MEHHKLSEQKMEITKKREGKANGDKDLERNLTKELELLEDTSSITTASEKTSGMKTDMEKIRKDFQIISEF